MTRVQLASTVIKSRNPRARSPFGEQHQPVLRLLHQEQRTTNLSNVIDGDAGACDDGHNTKG